MRDILPDDATHLYVERHFWRLPELAAAAGLDAESTLRLIRAGCAPGPVYAWSGQWWSALAASRGLLPSAPPDRSELFYSRSAAWDLRRASLHVRAGASPEMAAIANRDHFAARFAQLMPEIDGADAAFAPCWTEGRFDPDRARIAAHAEWASWLQGAYGVCLRVFAAQNCIAKEALAARLKRRISECVPASDLLDDAQALAGLILPFAPWERPSGTPGLTIDALLVQAALGDDLPYR